MRGVQGPCAAPHQRQHPSDTCVALGQGGAMRFCLGPDGAQAVRGATVAWAWRGQCVAPGSLVLTKAFRCLPLGTLSILISQERRCSPPSPKEIEWLEGRTMRLQRENEIRNPLVQLLAPWCNFWPFWFLKGLQ